MSATSNSLDELKRKYRDAINDHDRIEERMRHDATQLHKGLLRLCFSFNGVDPGLDRSLAETQTELKKIKDADERNELIVKLLEQVSAFVAEGDLKTSATDPTELLRSLIGSIDAPEPFDKELELFSNRCRDGKIELVGGTKDIETLAAIINDAIKHQGPISNETLSDSFVEFLNRFSLSGSIGEKVAALQQRSSKIKSDLERLLVIDDTIALLTEELDEDAARTRGAKEARTIVRELIEWMSLPSQVADNLKEIQSKLDGSVSFEGLSAVLRDLGNAVSQFHGSLMSELSDVEYYLKNIAIRLKELQAGLEEGYQDQHASFVDSAALSENISEKIDHLMIAIDDEQDLELVKEVIDSGFQDIQLSMRTHLERNQQRVSSGEQRLAKLSERLRRMDQESTRLRAQVRVERERAHSDALTQIPNRAAYDERLRTEIARLNRHDRTLSLAVIDIDKFKSVNDKLGHDAGDKVLKNVAQICASNVRGSDFLARYGGEEFVLVLPETDIEQAFVVAEKLREKIEHTEFYHRKNRVPISISIGLACAIKNEDPGALFQRADRSLYKAKEQGRNRCVADRDTRPLSGSTED